MPRNQPLKICRIGLDSVSLIADYDAQGKIEMRVVESIYLVGPIYPSLSRAEPTPESLYRA